MDIPKYARYDYCVQKACDFLEEYSIKSFPINPLDIIQKEEYGLMKYSELMKEYNCSLDKVCTCLRSSDGKTILEDGIYSIAYNDFKAPTRIRFTLMHEIGHIYLNHLVNFEKTEILRHDKLSTSLTKQEYQVLENEANAFARNVLSPVSMYFTLKDKSLLSVSRTFGLSISAVQTRVGLINTDAALIKNLNLSHKIMLVYRRFMKKHKCAVCEAQFYEKHKYCPICGNQNSLLWGDGKMIYQKLDTYEDNKLIECPTCQNEETDIDGPYCQICGEHLINHCTNDLCMSNLPSNARYCPLCGSYSSFYQRGILKTWNYKEPTGFMEIPELDPELPFY